VDQSGGSTRYALPEPGRLLPSLRILAPQDWYALLRAGTGGQATAIEVASRVQLLV
jgi:hypothetical protein